MSGAIKINGTSSGSTTITAPASGADETIELSTALASKLDLAGGKILQVVRATDSTNRSTTSTSTVDVTGMSVTITPTIATSAIHIIAYFRLYVETTSSTGNHWGQFAISDSANNSLNGAEAVKLGEVQNSAAIGRHYFQVAIRGYSTPATTAATTYKLRFSSGSSAATINVENNLCTGQLYAIEVSA